MQNAIRSSVYAYNKVLKEDEMACKKIHLSVVAIGLGCMEMGSLNH